MAETAKKKGLALHWQILIGIGLGIVAGIVLCKITPYENWYKYIKWAGDIFLRGLRMIVIPLVFTSIALGVAGMATLQRWDASPERRCSITSPRP